MVGSCAGRGGAGREAHPQEERQRRLPRLWCVWSGCTMMQHGTHSASLPFCQPACWPALWLAVVCPRAWVAAFHSQLAAPLPHAPDVYCAAVMPPLPAGFVRMARKEEAEVACQTVKEVMRCAFGPPPDRYASNSIEAQQRSAASQSAFLAPISVRWCDTCFWLCNACHAPHSTPRSPPPLQCCGVPVALSLAGGTPLPELLAAAAAAAAATPLKLPQADDSSVAQLLQAVRRQPDRQAVVTSALASVLNVPSRPRLAFPSVRRSPPPTPAATSSDKAAPTGKAPVANPQQRKAAAGAGRVGGEGSVAAEAAEGQPSFAAGRPAVMALLAEFRCGAAWVQLAGLCAVLCCELGRAGAAGKLRFACQTGCRTRSSSEAVPASAWLPSAPAHPTPCLGLACASLLQCARARGNPSGSGESVRFLQEPQAGHAGCGAARCQLWKPHR